ncbi:MAG: hypothetical protein ABR991_04495 [Terracidiphilus sp.]
MLSPKTISQLLQGELRPGAEPSRFSAVFEKVGAGCYTLVIKPQAAARAPRAASRRR